MCVNALVDQKTVERRFHKAFALYVGRGKRFQVQALADATGIPLRTIKSYQAETVPGLANLFALVTVMGQGFFRAVIEDLPFEVIATEPGEVTPQKLLSEALAFSRDLSVMLEDGRIDHRERPVLQGRAVVMAEQLQELINELKEIA